MNLSTRLWAWKSRLVMLACCLAFAAPAAHAQTAPTWASVQRSASSGTPINGANPSSYGSHIAIAPDGSQYVSGLFVGNVTLGGSTLTAGPGQGHAFLAKYSPTGTVLWVKQLESPALGLDCKLAVDAAGNAYLTGYFAGTLAVGATTLTTAATYGAFLVKYDAQGTQQWLRQGTGNATTAKAIAIDGSGNVAIIGEYQNTVDFGGTVLTGTGVFYYKFSSAGAPLQATRVSSRCFTLALGFDGADKAYFTGSFYGTATFGSTALTSAGGNDAFLCQLDASAVPVWAQRTGGLQDDSGVGLAVDAAGNAAVAGYTDYVAAGNSNIYLARFSASGGALWSRQLAPSGTSAYCDAEAVAYDGRGGIWLTGRFASTVVFGTTPLTATNSISSYVARYDTQGNASWVARPTGNTICSGIAADASGNTFLTGAAFGPVAFGGLPLTSGDLDTFVAKLTAGGILTATRATTSSLALTAYPNPASGSATVVLPAGGGRLTLLDALGRTVRRQALPTTAGPCPVALAGLAPGLYQLRATLGNGQVAHTALQVQ